MSSENGVQNNRQNKQDFEIKHFKLLLKNNLNNFFFINLLTLYSLLEYLLSQNKY